MHHYYSRRGQIYEKLDQYEEALADYKKRVELEPSSSGNRSDVERVQRKLNK